MLVCSESNPKIDYLYKHLLPTWENPPTKTCLLTVTALEIADPESVLRKQLTLPLCLQIFASGLFRGFDSHCQISSNHKSSKLGIFRGFCRASPLLRQWSGYQRCCVKRHFLCSAWVTDDEMIPPGRLFIFDYISQLKTQVNCKVKTNIRHIWSGEIEQ